MLIETDIWYNLSYFILIFNGVLILLSSIFWHELGHLLYYKLVKNRNVKIYYLDKNLEVGKSEDYDCLSEPEYKSMLLSGIGFGIIPIIVCGILNPIYFLIVFGYGFGCWHDITELNLNIQIE